MKYLQTQFISKKIVELNNNQVQVWNENNESLSISIVVHEKLIIKLQHQHFFKSQHNNILLEVSLYSDDWGSLLMFVKVIKIHTNVFATQFTEQKLNLGKISIVWFCFIFPEKEK